MRNDEWEVYCGWMESVLRSMEGFEGFWRLLFDFEGYDILFYVYVVDLVDLGIIILRLGL